MTRRSTEQIVRDTMADLLPEITAEITKNVVSAVAQTGSYQSGQKVADNKVVGLPRKVQNNLAKCKISWTTPDGRSFGAYYDREWTWVFMPDGKPNAEQSNSLRELGFGFKRSRMGWAFEDGNLDQDTLKEYFSQIFR